MMSILLPDNRKVYVYKVSGLSPKDRLAFYRELARTGGDPGAKRPPGEIGDLIVLHGQDSAAVAEVHKACARNRNIPRLVLDTRFPHKVIDVLIKALYDESEQPRSLNGFLKTAGLMLLSHVQPNHGKRRVQVDSPFMSLKEINQRLKDEIPRWKVLAERIHAFLLRENATLN